MPQSPYSAPSADGPLDAVLRLPGSKSLTNRELVLAALADGPGVLRAPLRSRDTGLMAAALRALGAEIADEGPDWRIRPIAAPAGRRIGVDVGLSGTVMRFVPPVAALVTADVTFDGDEGARRRPMATTIRALRDLGVAVDAEADRLPFTVRGAGSVRGGELAIDASASSQFVSGLLLAAPRFELGLVLRHTGARLPSIPHIEMTIACLRARGVEVESPEPGVWALAPGQPIRAADPLIEPDLSNAAPFLAAALVAGGRVRVEHWPAATTQVGALLAELLPRFGARVTAAQGSLTVDGGAGVLGGARLPGVDLDLGMASELVPTIVGLAALSPEPSRITGIGHMRGHETDRLAAFVADLEALGGRARELPDGIEVLEPARHGGLWRAFADHRMATTGALLGLVIPGVEVDDIGATTKTLPEFVDLWEAMLVPAH